MGPQRYRLQRIYVLVVILAVVPSLARSARVIVAYDPQQAEAVGEKLKEAGYPIHLQLKGPHFFAIDLHEQWTFLPAALRRSEAAYVAASLAKLRKVPGVLDAVLDEKRYFVSAQSADEQSAIDDIHAFSEGTSSPMRCRNENKPLSDDWFPEMQPWGISKIQADSQVLQQPLTSNITDAGVMICIVDSGMDTQHPDLRNNSLDGCKFEDMNAPGGCPFPWDEDILGHGTHVAGVIAGIRNNVGTRGVIPEGAELYTVRVYNNTGDVNQGQGFVYGSSLIQAYTQCEGRLSYLQAIMPSRKYRMVVNLSLGATGPLTIEQLYFREAYSRGDIIFVSAAGNNGTDPDDMLTMEGTNYCSYPACYKEVISVGAVDCNDSKPAYSQFNAAVDLMAPGSDILSALPMNLSEPNRRGYLEHPEDSTVRYRNIGGVVHSGINTVTDAPVVDCGYGDLLEPCPVPKGGVCFFQGRIRGFFNPSPNVTFCDRVLACYKWGGAGVIISAPFLSLDRDNKTIPYPEDAIPSINLDCRTLDCSCFAELEKISVYERPPAVIINNVQGRKVLDGVKAAADAKKQYKVTLATQHWYQGYKSGTSMATPFVSGALAQVWAAFPNCNNTEVWNAFEVSAIDLGRTGKDVNYGFGKISVEKAYLYLAKQPCGQKGATAPAPAVTNRTGEGRGSPSPKAPEPMLALWKDRVKP